MSDLVMTGATADELWPLVRDYHYSRKMPSAARHCFAWRKAGGLFGDTGEVVAGAIFGNPVNRNWPSDALELQRLIRRDDFTQPLSALLSFSLKWLKANTTVPFVLSYVDTGQGHHGGIYQASGWKFVATSKARQDGVICQKTGRYIHGRQIGREFGTQKRAVLLDLLPEGYELAWHEQKNLYIFPLRQKLKTLLRRFDWQELSFPKPLYAARPLDAPGTTGIEAGATPAGRSNIPDAA
jgi:hypothetical protein